MARFVLYKDAELPIREWRRLLSFVPNRQPQIRWRRLLTQTSDTQLQAV